MAAAGDHDVRVHVASINTAPATELAVRTIRRRAGYPHQLVVGDGGSTDGTIAVLRKLEARGWLRLEVAPEGRKQAAWFDSWVESCEQRYAVFVDSDMEFHRTGWLADMVDVVRRTGAALVCGEMRPERPDNVNPMTGGRLALQARPSSWLLLVDVEQIRPLGSSFHFEKEDPAGPDAIPVAYDVGGIVLRDLVAAGMTWEEMPQEFRDGYTHYRGLSWKRKGRLDRQALAKLARVHIHLLRERLVDTLTRGRGASSHSAGDQLGTGAS